MMMMLMIAFLFLFVILNLSASGDDGAVSFTNAACSSTSSIYSGGWNGGPLIPSWPSSSPYVLSVGATDFYNGITNGARTSPYYSKADGADGTDGKICGPCADDPTSAVYCQIGRPVGAMEQAGII